MFEEQGELKVVTGEEVPLPACYVKVYARRRDGSVRFFKDGYTDLRGRFEYGALSGESIEGVETFAVFVQHEEHGSMSREVRPPAGASTS